MNRRSILKAAFGIAATPATVSVKAAAAAIGADTALAAGCESVSVCGGLKDVTVSREYAIWRAIDQMRDRARYASTPERHLPPRIAAMRSWSPVYKASVFAREQAILDAYYRKVNEDDAFAEALFESIGLPLPRKDNQDH